MSDWQALVSEIESSECGMLYPGTKCIIGRGSLSPKIVFIGEAPGAEEDKQGLPFVGRSGKLLDQWIEYVGITEEDYFITNVVKCRPPNNRDPTKEEIAACAPYLAKQLEILQPEIIVCVGRFAMNYFLPKEKSILKSSGKLLEGRYYVVPHPSYFLRKGGTGWEPYLKQLCNLLGTVPGSSEKQETLF